jgi:hypothetical protein
MVFPLVCIVLIFCIAGLLFIVLRARRTLGAYRIPRETGLLIPSDKFYKGRSPEKTPLQQLEFFLLRSPLNEAGSVLAFRAICSVAELRGPAVWGFSTSGFHRLLATKPVSSETSKAERG